MAATSVAALRALNRARLCPLPSRTVAAGLASRTAAHNAQILCSNLSRRALQTRQQSTSNRPSEASQAGKDKGRGRAGPSSRPPPPPPPPQSKMHLLMRLLSVRGLFSSLTPDGIKTLYRQSPGELVIALIILGSLLGISGYIGKVCLDYFYARQFTKYPAPIAKSLRRALYYTNISPEPELAKKWYKTALEQCDELGLDPYSDDVLGIRIQIAAWLEKIANFQGAITVLESVKNDCTKWVQTMEKGVQDGTVDKEGRVPVIQKDDKEVVPENLWRKRTRLLAKAVGTSTKLGELYADDHVNDSDNSQARLTWAVETALSESRRRSTEGVKAEEGQWLTPEEFGGAMESLAHHYESKSQFHLAVPLLFQALRLCQMPCHRPTIMNNLAAAFAQHPVLGSPESIPDAPATTAALSAPGMPTTRDGFLEAARNWARNARQHAKDVKSDDRTLECDEACAVALSNMADIAAMRGNPVEARRRFQECIDLSSKIGFDRGVAQAKAGLRNLNANMKAPAAAAT